MGWESDALFTVMDQFTTSAAENNQNKFKKAMEDLNRELPKIALKLEETAQIIQDTHNSLRGNGDPSSGKMIIDFENRREKNKKDFDRLMSYYKNMENNVKQKLVKVEDEYFRWSSIANREDYEKKQYGGR